MSRVRILNLPNDCTEQQLRDFIAKDLPTGSPSVEITDVLIKRFNPPSRMAGEKNKLIGKEQPPLGKIRMAFVGFKTSAAGRFIAKYFHNSYFRSSRIHVELAKGLNDPGLTTNAKKNLGSLEQGHTPKHEGLTTASATKRRRDEAADGKFTSDDAKITSSINAKKTKVEEGMCHDVSVSKEKKDVRRTEFVDERIKATEGPSWAAEVLVPSSGNTWTTTEKLLDNTATVGGSGMADIYPVEVSEEERKALERQQALGDVEDTDFLNNITAPVESDLPSASSNSHKMTENAVDENRLHSACIENADRDEENPSDKEAKIARKSRRVRITNIPYSATEENIKQFTSSLVGPVEAVHIPLTKDTRQSKGSAFVRFCKEEDALRALSLCNGVIFMGRLLRVNAAEEDPHSKRVIAREAQRAAGAPITRDDSAGNHLGSSSFKVSKEMERHTRGVYSTDASVSWNATYMNAHTAVDAVAQRIGLRSEDIVAVTSKGAAVRAAIAEAHLTNEVRQVFSDEGVNFDLLESSQHNLLKPRSNTTILVKNLSLKQPQDVVDLTQLFLKFGALEATVFPSSGAFALFRYLHPQDARIAFSRLAFKPFRNTPLFLEWAQIGSIVEDADEMGIDPNCETKHHETLGEDGEGANAGATASDAQTLSSKTTVYTLFITNIPFSATEDDLRDFLVDSCPRLARRATELIQRLVHQRELGRAFLTVPDARTFTYCLTKLNGSTFDGRTLSCVASKQSSLALGKGQADNIKYYRNTGANEMGSGEYAEKDEEHDLSKVKSVVASRKMEQSSSGSGGPKVPPGCDPCKIVVKNLPFEATEQDVRDLFSAFSEVRSVRVPRKNNNFTSHRENNHRGFAFVEFLSEAEAARAFVLGSTHLYGRHLVLQYAKLE
ncbi:unnamed protein product [Phytomonas sp. EM1]|nr:unnamed protein product [Phytomonas sp. EM1]|eukprot:CCW63585.1 unnamed protein product [Phytomonas sp. isolate EM1]